MSHLKDEAIIWLSVLLKDTSTMTYMYQNVCLVH